MNTILSSTHARRDLHRGVTWRDMPGRGSVQKRLRFAMFRRGQWPPACYKVPAELEGVALVLFLEERSAMYDSRKGGKA